MVKGVFAEIKRKLMYLLSVLNQVEENDVFSP